MHATSSNNPEGSQFRRQLIATVAGALIAMSTTTGVALFQWVTQSKERRHQNQVEALSQFAAEVSRSLGYQAVDWHLANRCNYIAARARQLAATSDLTTPDALTEYKELLNTAWTLESEITKYYQERAQQSAASAAAYYKVQVAFDESPSNAMGPVAEQVQPWRIMSQSPKAEELQSMASLFDSWSTTFTSDAGATARLYNGWNEQVKKLSALAQK